MDYLESLGKQLSEITVYDIKSYYNQAKNMVMNYTEMESKVRDATNDEPWGASSSLMNEIAQATGNYQLFNEIMPTIYKRFTEKEASEWRQIYKALQLLEYLVKNGSERVVDDARTHIAMIKILRNFHYIDEKVRNRAKELAELLSDLDKVRAERKKAKANKSKYSGIGSSTGFGSGSMSSGSRYTGFGSDSPSWDNEGPSSMSGSSFRDTSSRRPQFDEYDAGDDEDQAHTPPPPPSSTTKSPIRNKAEVKAPAKEVNLFDDDWDEPVVASTAPVASTAAKAPASLSLDDDFDDFQSATPATSSPKPASMNNVQNIMSSFNAPSPPPSNTTASKPNFFDMMNNSSTTSIQPQKAPTSSYTSPIMSPSLPASNIAPQQQQNFSSFAPMAPNNNSAQKPKTSANAFDDLWATNTPSLATNGTKSKQTIADLAKQKADAQIWSAPAKNQGSSTGGFDDLLF